jgi:uncharacterized repeat protein (TIGR03806 family)
MSPGGLPPGLARRAAGLAGLAGLAVLAWSAAFGCGGGEGGAGDGDAGPDAGSDVCAVAAGTGVSFDADARFCDRLSSYRFFVGAGDTLDTLAALAPNQGVLPYDVNSPLFSDYTVKDRFVWLPPGTSMGYHDSESFDMPVGTALLKTFGYLDDMREPRGGRRLLETRILARTSAGWRGITYVWNQDQSEAHRQVAGDTIEASWIHDDGEPRQIAYSVPNENQCKNCHEEHDDIVGPIGPKARHLNRDYVYEDGPDNQLVRLAEVGALTGLPADLEAVPRAPVWNDADSGTLDARARAWLDINCAHCHNPTGAARTSGLDLSADQSNPYEYGVCKGPVAAGGGSGGRLYNIVPGAPDSSILVYRIESMAPDVRMPEVGRQLVDQGGVDLIRTWIAAMEGECAAL